MVFKLPSEMYSLFAGSIKSGSYKFYDKPIQFSVLVRTLNNHINPVSITVKVLSELSISQCVYLVRDSVYYY